MQYLLFQLLLFLIFLQHYSPICQPMSKIMFKKQFKSYFFAFLIFIFSAMKLAIRILSTDHQNKAKNYNILKKQPNFCQNQIRNMINFFFLKIITIIYIYLFKQYYNKLIMITTKLASSRSLIFAAYELFSSNISIKNTKSIVLKKRKNKMLAELKKQIAKKQPIKPVDLYQEYHYRDVYQKINIDMEAFFYQRPYTITNFNFLLNLVAEQCPSNYESRITEIIKKMEMLGIDPDEKSYNYMIKAATNAKNPQKAQQIFYQASKKFLPNKYLYTSLLQTYVQNNNPYMGLKVLDEMIEKDIEPDLPAFTTLINCFRKGRKLEKCWEVHRKLVKSQAELDEIYVAVMLKVYAATHDAEKAIKLYKENIQQKGIKPMIETTNSYLKALSSRKQYANYVIDKVFYLIESGAIVTTQTIDWALRACSRNGSIKSAGQFLKIMKIKKLEIKQSTFNILLRVYSRACLIPNQQQSIREIIIVDSWKILEEMKKKDMVNTTALNNLLAVYANSINHHEVDGLILPLYEKFNLEQNVYTYEILIEMYYKLNDFTTVLRVWKQMFSKLKQNEEKMIEKYGDNKEFHKIIEKKNQELRPTFKSLQIYLDIGIKMMDMNQVLEALKLFKQMDRMPKNQTLKFLGNLKNLPEQIQVSLMDFKIKFGSAKIKKGPSPLVQDPQNVK